MSEIVTWQNVQAQLQDAIAPRGSFCVCQDMLQQPSFQTMFLELKAADSNLRSGLILVAKYDSSSPIATATKQTLIPVVGNLALVMASACRLDGSAVQKDIGVKPLES